MTTTTTTLTGERADLLEALATHRYFLRHTVQGLTDEQARQRTTVSELTLGGLVKHVAHTEATWARFIVEGPGVMAGPDDPDQMAQWAEEFRMGPDETLEGILAHYEEVAARTDELVRTLPDLDAAQPLPEAPWFPPNAVRSARRVFVHVIAETAQHAGHADILRESLDGQKTMG
ncbi:DinB family protein [Geodermatophilus sp. SYSU D00079]